MLHHLYLIISKILSRLGYRYNKLTRNIIFNFNKLVSDLEIDANTPDS